MLVLLAQVELHEAQVEYDVAARELRAKDAEARHLDMRAVQVTHGNAGPPATRRAWGGRGGLAGASVRATPCGIRCVRRRGARRTRE